MKTWLTLKDLSDYLQISENKIRYLIKHKQIPYHDNHGFLRFERHEIDEWMKEPVSVKKEIIGQVPDKTNVFLYRDKPIKRFTLTANKILIGNAPWNRLPGFIKSFVERTKEIKIHDDGREFLQRKEFAIFSNNFNDYLRVCCQLGLIDKRKGIGKQKEYYPTESALTIYSAENIGEIQPIILKSILEIVKKKWEAVPDERHSIFLLWLILSLKEKVIEPGVQHFVKDDTELKNYCPLIRLNFSKSLCQFLFHNDSKKEQLFLHEWNKLIDSKRTRKGEDAGDRLPLFDQ
jgi:excisionase family DNA binding protein